MSEVIDTNNIYSFQQQSNNCSPNKNTINLELFTEEAKQIVKDYICFICKSIFREPYGSNFPNKCQHVFCKDCILNSDYMNCPQCASEDKATALDKRSLKPKTFLINFIDKQILFCKNKNEDCNWKGTVKEFNSHLAVCSKEKVHCSFNNCSLLISRDEKEVHESSCEFKFTSCSKCSQTKVQANNFEKHYEECPKEIIPCTNGCSQIIERGMMGEHIKNKCENVYVSCDFEAYGCNEKVLKKDFKAHLDNLFYEHNFMLIEFHSNFINSVDKNLDEISKASEGFAVKVKDLEQKAKIIIEEESKVKNVEKGGKGGNGGKGEKVDKVEKVGKGEKVDKGEVQEKEEEEEEEEENKNDIKMLNKKQKRNRKFNNVNNQTKNEKKKDINLEENKKSNNLIVKEKTSFESSSNNNIIPTNKNNCNNNLPKQFNTNTNASNCTITSISNRSKNNIFQPLKNVEILRTRSQNQKLLFIDKDEKALKIEKTLINPTPIQHIKETFTFTKKNHFIITNGIKIKDTKLIVTEQDPENPHQLILYDYKLNENPGSTNNNSYTPFKWQIEVNFSQNKNNSNNNWMAFGVCIKEAIEKKLNYIEKTPSGMFSISSEGILCHNNSSFKNNNKINNFPESKNIRTVCFDYNYSNKELTISIGQENWKIYKVFATDKKCSLVPCVVLKNKGDELNFII